MKNIFKLLTDKMENNSETLEALESSLKACGISESADTESTTIKPIGEVGPLGLENLKIGDVCISASSNTGNAKNARLNSMSAWVADQGDISPYLTIELPDPCLVTQVVLQGGENCGNNTDGGIESSQLLTYEKASALCDQYLLNEVTGEVEQTYEIVGYVILLNIFSLRTYDRNVLSWKKLLKTDKIPSKLFKRPPVRFMHDLISTVISNTGFAKDLFNDAEKDYYQLPKKEDRVSYLSKIITFVQER